ncbi:MAG: M23 family metallopeptidase [Bacteroidales bacterium]|nr:M23 family metallopeptidase [Bacteroidales bacterium]
MAKFKYQFNTQSLRIEKVDTTWKQRIVKLLSVLSSGLVIGLVLTFFAFSFFDSPKEKVLQRENQQWELQYQILSERMDQMKYVLNDLQDRDDNIYRVIFEQEPVPVSQRAAGYGGGNRYDGLEGYNNSEIIIRASKKLDSIASKSYVQSKSFDDVFELARNKEQMLASIPAIQPVSNKDLKRISSFYGYRTDPIYKVRKLHEGMDFSAPTGTPVYATGDGVIKMVNKSRKGYGNTLMIDHGYNYQTLYGHLSKFVVKKGQKVKRGQIVAYVGNTGKSTAPHLHYEVRKNERKVNPMYYFFNDITPEQFEEVIANSTKPGQSFD